MAGEAEVEETYAQFVSQAGYPTDSIDGVILATGDQNYPVREAGVELLARRYGQDKPEVVLPVLRKLAEDPEIAPRATAAYWLARLGDASGLQVLNREYMQRVPGGSDAQRCAEVDKYQVKDALWIGKMLAELGNPIALALAAYVGNSGEFDTLKSSSVRTLGAISWLDKEFPEQAAQAIEALQDLAGKKIDPFALALIVKETERPGFPPESAARIQNILEQSGRLPSYISTPRMRANAQAALRDARRKVASSRSAQAGVHLEPEELQMRISHRESRTFHVALAGGPENCVVKEVLSDEPSIQASPRAEADRKGYTIDITVKETTPQNRTNYIVVQLEGCERPFLVLPVKFFRQVATRPAGGPASRPVSLPE